MEDATVILQKKIGQLFFSLAQAEAILNQKATELEKLQKRVEDLENERVRTGT